VIVKMSKIEIIGLRKYLTEVIDLVRQEGNLHIDPSTVGFIAEQHKHAVHSLLPDEQTVFEKVFLTGLQEKIQTLIAYLPNLPVRVSYLSPQAIMDTISSTLDNHLAVCRQLFDRKESLTAGLQELAQYRFLLKRIGGLIEGLSETADIEYLGLTVRDKESELLIRALLDAITNGSYELIIDEMEDGTLIGLVAIEKSLAERVKSHLAEKKVPELPFPADIRDLPFAEKMLYLKTKSREMEEELATVNRKLEEFTRRWAPIYRNSLRWIEDRLSIIQATGLVFESRMCFFIYGWVPSGKVESLRAALREKFNDHVLLEEMEIEKSDLERVPVILKNPPIMMPFEHFTRLLPLPAYTSYDPTPFIAIFFPVFFGMILGDAGYGLLLFTVAMFITAKAAKFSPLVRDAGVILRFCALYSILFGLLFGELLGDLPHRLLGIEPLLLDRQAHILPLLYFALAIGFIHIIIGLVLGILSAWKRDKRKEVLVKALHIVLIICISILILSFFGFHPELLSRPILIAIAVLCPVLLVTGGLLAPLELLKDFGNIISYVRIMAIGLTSVLLAYVANQLSGITGDILLGLIFGGLIHLMNIIIGVFSSSIHSLRLHYVEFFDKFLDLGGRHYKPLRKN
jgi:V/A-type H+-transporting ATPase subunit I